eukprot:GHVS01043846.1.p1 GENE.GHVS01043846.1~~GHVS01043846.1.p1  ORF type:complete len:306 (-),score=22.88 GHVS01043846.1:64-981(-)
MEEVPVVSSLSQRRSYCGISKEQIVKHYELETRDAWRPVLTWKFAAVAAFLVSVAFVCVGIACIVSSYFQVECTYTYEVADKSLVAGEEGGTSSTEYSTFAVNSGHCTNTPYVDPATQTSHISGPIQIYYKLTNVYQNDSIFMQSVIDEQLRGHVITDRRYVRQQCGDKNSFVNNDEENGKILHPCGAFARSFFNDTLISISADEAAHYPLDIRRTPKDIAWSGDVDKFSDVKVFEGLPPSTGSGVANGNFIVWMRPSALSTFRKLWGVLDDGLPLPFYVTIRNSKCTICRVTSTHLCDVQHVHM